VAKISGSHLIAKSMQREGIDTLFGLVAGPIIDIMTAALHYGIRPIDVRHEQAAAYSATGWAFVKNSVGVATMGAGPGVSNAVTGAHVAWDNCIPILLLGGGEALNQRGNGVFQETHLDMFRRVTKSAMLVESVARIPEIMATAFRIARTGRPGPVYLDLPSDVINGSVDEEQVRWPNSYYTKSAPQGDPEAVKRAAELLLKAERPAMLVGKGVRWSEPTRELRQIVETLGMPFLPSPMGRGFIPDDHPLNMSSARSSVLSNADVVLVVGARLNWVFDFGRRFKPDTKIIHIDIEPEEIGRNHAVDVGIVGDAKAVLGQILAELRGKTAGMAERAAEGPWLSSLRADVQRNQATLDGPMHSDAVPIRTHRLLREVREVFPRDTIYVVDGHVTLAAGRQMLPSYTPASRLNSGSSGCMGVGVPFAVGAALARPNVPVVSVNGDSAFGFNGFEVDTAVRNKLPITFIVNNNGGIAGHTISSRMDLPQGFNGFLGNLSQETRYDIIAQGMGAHPEYVTQPDQIRPALQRAMDANKQGKVSLVHVISEPMETDTMRVARGRGSAGAVLGY
jgi:thiamine pyrophosphate-dependent acetolactate synthase large subunit-like protein